MTSLDAGEFWLGLEKMHSITGDRGSQMAVQLQDWDGNAKLLQFPIHLGGEDTAYSLQLTEPTASELGATNVSPSGLSLPFSTWDQDHDLRGDLNCAKSLSGKQRLLPLSSAFRTKVHHAPVPFSPCLLCALGPVTDLISVFPSLKWPYSWYPLFRVILKIQ